MAQLVSIRKATIYNRGKQLDVEIEYYKTIVRVYLIDKKKYFPIVWDYKFPIKQWRKMSILDIREMAINLKLL